MQSNRVWQSLESNGFSLGTFVMEFNSTGISRIAGAAGVEFVVFDMEHTGYSIETIRGLVATTPRSTVVPIVRVPATEYHFIARVLDIGALGIMVPMVESVEQAERLVQSAKYPPHGRRGAAFGVAHDDYLTHDIREEMRSSDEEQILIAQIETVAGLENVEAIAAVEGIDVLWIGHFDLTNSLGIPGEFDHPDFHAAITRVLEACKTHDKVGGFLASDPQNAVDLLQSGFRMIALGADLWLYQQALATGLQEVRGKFET